MNKKAILGLTSTAVIGTLLFKKLAKKVKTYKILKDEDETYDFNDLNDDIKKYEKFKEIEKMKEKTYNKESKLAKDILDDKKMDLYKKNVAIDLLIDNNDNFSELTNDTFKTFKKSLKCDFE